jgi:N,N'-diacetyllegionaminate synthase
MSSNTNHKINYIAEIGWNFMGDLNLAEQMVKAASNAGATTVKFQYWNPDKLKPGPWDTDGRREIYNKAKLNEVKIIELKKICKECKVKFLVSVFNSDDLLFISNFSNSEIKIPSHEVANLQLIKNAISYFDKIYLSLGACSAIELENVSKVIKNAENKVVSMHCVSSYPCNPENINLPRIDRLKSLFSTEIGLSDHTDSPLIPALAVTKGVTVIEKHFTNDRNLPGRDNKFAMLPNSFAEMVRFCEESKLANIDHGLDAQEIEHDTMNNYRGRWG